MARTAGYPTPSASIEDRRQTWRGFNRLGSLNGRGFSIDLWLDGSPKDARGFYRPEDAVALLQAVHQAARAVGAEWRVLYNDYAVARVINQETGARWGAARWHMHKQTFVRTGGTYAPEHPEVPKGQLQHHLDLQKTPWSRLPQSARSIAEAAFKGRLRNPIGLASEFGSTYVYFHDQYGRYPSDEEWGKYTDAYARRKKWVWVGPIPGLHQKKNALFIQAAVAKLPPNTVRVVPPQ